MRSELFGRVLYLVINTLYAKVCKSGLTLFYWGLIEK